MIDEFGNVWGDPWVKEANDRYQEGIQKVLVGDFVTIYLKIEKEYKLTPLEAKVFGLLYDGLCDGSWASVPDRAIAEFLGCSIGAVNRSIRKLESKKLILKKMTLLHEGFVIRELSLNKGFLLLNM